MTAVYVTAAEIAERDQVTRKAVQKIVRKLAEAGMPVERDGRGRIVRFSQAWFDDHRERYGDSVKAPVKAVVADDQTMDEARRREAWLRVDREELKKQQLAGSLIRVDELTSALEKVAVEIQSIIARLPNKADDLALSVTKQGVHGLRLELRKVAFDINTDIADRMEQIWKDAPAEDPAMEVENR